MYSYGSRRDFFQDVQSILRDLWKWLVVGTNIDISIIPNIIYLNKSPPPPPPQKKKRKKKEKKKKYRTNDNKNFKK